MFKKALLSASLAFLGFSSFAQMRNVSEKDYSKFHFGLGFGMDYGGIGVKAEFLPIKYVGVFGGLGFNFDGPGFNVGVNYRPLPDKKIQPILMAMYGYNGVIHIKGDENTLSNFGLGGINKTYYGPSVGLGGELRVGHRDNRLYMGLWLPFRSKEFKDNYDIVKNSPYVDIETDVLPVTFSIGFN